MWKKAGWLYLGLYTLGVLTVIVINAQRDIRAGAFDPIMLLFPLLWLIPAGVLALGLRGKKVSILLTLLGLLITAVPVAGILNFNSMDLATMGKLFIFLPLITGLIYFGYKRLFHK